MTPMEFFDPPLLKYYGGKWQLADWIISHFPPHKSYIEPYCGAASVFLRKYPSEVEVLNDTNRDLLNFFDVLRERTDALIRAIDLMPFSYAEYERSFEPVDDPLEAARRFYVRSWQAFGSGGIARKTGWRRMLRANRGTSPAHDWSRLDGLWLAVRRLKEAQIDCLDALDCIERYDEKQALFYVDPPYVLTSRQRITGRYTHEMTDGDHRELASMLHRVKGLVLISGYDCPLYRELYAGWHAVSKTTTTNGNSKAIEYLWISPRANALSTLPLFRQGEPTL